MGVLNLVVAKDQIAGTDPATYVGLLISFVTFFLSLFRLAGWVKRLLRLVAGIALLEFVLLVVPMRLWVRVVVGLVLFAAGFVWVVRASRKDHATDQQHTKQIHDVLDRVDNALKNEGPSNLENSDTAIITHHFPKLAKQVKAWDDVAKAVDEFKQRLRDSVESGLRDLGADNWPYKFDSIRDGLCAITEARTADGAASAQQFPPMIEDDSKNPIFTFHYDDGARFALLAFNEAATGVKGDLVLLAGDSYPDNVADKVGEKYGTPIYDFLRGMQTWSSPKNLNRKRDELKKFPKASLQRALKKSRDKTYYRRAQGCPECKQMSS